MLKDYYLTVDQEFQQQEVIYKRSKELETKVREAFPEIDCECQLSLSAIGKTCIRAFIYLPKEVTEAQTRKLIKWLNRFMGNAERDFREQEGNFFWRGKREIKDSEFGDYDELVFLEGTNPLTCEIVQVKKEVTVYQSVCK